MNSSLNLLKYLPVCALCFVVCAQTLPTRIDIVVVEGEGVVNYIGQRAPHDTVVRVDDENGRPITGAAVVFTLPTNGATGDFANGSKSVTVVTDSNGLAAARVKTNQAPGKMPIHVTASYRGLRARIFVNQMNAGEATSGQKHTGRTLAILAIIGAAAGGGAYAATHKGNTSTANNTPAPAAAPAAISISPGTGSIAPPR